MRCMKVMIPERAWYPVCRSQQLGRKPLKRRLLGQDLVLFRQQEGRAVALLDRCPHRNVPLSEGWVQRGTLVCPYHGWRFGERGECLEIPGRCAQRQRGAHAAPYFALREQQGLIWVYGRPREEPQTEPFELPEYSSPGFSSVVWETQIQSSLPRLAENFLDGTHTHFVHNGLIRKQSKKRRALTVKVVRKANYVEAQYLNDPSLSGLIRRILAPGASRLDGFGRFWVPGIAQLEYRSDRDFRLFISACLSPIDAEHQRVFAVMTFRWGPPNFLARCLATPLFRLALRQDKRIVEMQSQNIAQYGEERFVYTELDLLAPHIHCLLNAHAKNSPPAADHHYERSIDMMI